MRKNILIYVLFLVPVFSLFAHPHMLVFARCELEFAEDKLKGFWVELEFDSFFSGEIIWAYDEDKDGKFNKEETGNLYDGPFMALGDYNYFTYIRLGDERFSPNEIKSFSARAEGRELLFYRFFVPMDMTEKSDLYIALYDYSFFCAIRYQEDYLSFIGNTPENITIGLEENEDYPIYYNPLGKANDMTLYKKWSPGLSTFIPVEIHVQF